MILILRGHIRQTFETKSLYNFIKTLYNLHPDLQIFIHTWNKIANNISWRYIQENNQEVNEQMIADYFYDIKHLIQKIIIDDDSKIQLIGNTAGNVCQGPMPLLGWKNYWYGKFKIIDYLYQSKEDKKEAVINIRFDIFNNSNSFHPDFILQFIKYNITNETKFTKNLFLYNAEHTGIDNIYIGNIDTMYKLTYTFFYDLDNILLQNKHVYNQEVLVFRMNHILF